MYKSTSSTGILRISDGALIPADSGNCDYVEFLKWVSEGGSAAPADVPDAKLQIIQRIDSLERAEQLPRVTREFMLLFMEANNLTAAPGYAPVKVFDDAITALRSQL